MRNADNGRVLAGLHYFECVARHLSFTLAARELFLTQSAVSHRIRELEKDLGFALFHRFVRRIVLTEEGARLLAVLRRSLSEIEGEIREIQAQALGGSLSVVCGPSFLGCWLLPRLMSFYNQYPGIALNLRSQINPVDFENDRADMAIDYTNVRHPGVYSEVLLDEAIFPVCSPAYAEDHDLYDNPGALEHCLLLHDTRPWVNARSIAEWSLWLEHVQLEHFTLNKGYSFDRSEAALRMAVQGAGVAMGRKQLAAAWLASGDLVRPFSQTVMAPQSYVLVMPHDRVRNVRVKAFCAWLRSLCAETASA